ncbi:phosphate transport system permease protein PstA [archaeon BMS3Abin16]|nr:phosphate transport system permease protein PstA [archaeon BMS3Abin16]GBE56138.1 phosphate transport system permease protein PstA [archaeon BMS3Bbin16]
MKTHRSRRDLKTRIFKIVAAASTLIALIFLFLLLYDSFSDGLPWLDKQFLTSFPSRFPEKAGIKSALYGSVWLMAFTAIISVPIGVMAAVYLEEYAKDSFLETVIETNISNLAGVPSIVYGMLGLAFFVRALQLERSVLSGALTMTLLILPIIIISSQEAIRAVPKSIRMASYALGATKWETTRHHVIPNALPGILTGTILAMSRAVGEAAPLIMIGALTFIAFTPKTPFDPFTVLPIQIFNWVSRPKEEFRLIAAAGIIVLLVFLLTMNAVAILIRNRYQRYARW